VPLLAGGLVPADQNGACASMNNIIESNQTCLINARPPSLTILLTVEALGLGYHEASGASALC
jgi:hypothetical protein